MNTNSERNNYLDSIKNQIEQSNDINFVKAIALYQLNIEYQQTETINRLKKVIEDLIINSNQKPSPIFMFNKQGGEWYECQKRYKEVPICSSDDFETRRADLEKLREERKQLQKELKELKELNERKKIKRMIDSL